MIPHITNQIKEEIFRLREESKADALHCRNWRNSGRYREFAFLEAIRQIKNDIGKNNCLYVHADSGTLS